MYMEIFYLYINSLILVDTIRRVSLFFFDISESFVSIIRNVIYITIFFYVLWDSVKRKKIIFWVLPILIHFFLLGVSLLLEPSVSMIIFSGEGVLFILRCIPGFYFGMTIFEEVRDLNGLNKYYMLMIVYVAINFIFIDFNVDSGYMTFAYNVLFPLCFLTFESFIKPKLWKTSCIIITSFAILLMGARGPLAVLFSVGIIWLFYYLKKSRKKIICIGVLGSLITFLIVFFNNIVDFFYKIFPYSRTLFMMKNGFFFSMSGRDAFYNKIKLSLQNNFIVPHGIYSDRIFLNADYQGEAIGMYAHNLVYEWLYQYGGVCGVILCALFLILIIVSWRELKKINNNIYGIIYISFLAGVLMLFFSSSYLSNERFWVAVGIMFSLVKGKQKNIRNRRKRII